MTSDEKKGAAVRLSSHFSDRGRPKSRLSAAEALAVLIPQIAEARERGERNAEIIAVTIAPVLGSVGVVGYRRVVRASLGALGIPRERHDLILAAADLPPVDRYYRESDHRRQRKAGRPRRPRFDGPKCGRCGTFAVLDADGNCVNRSRCARSKRRSRMTQEANIV